MNILTRVIARLGRVLKDVHRIIFVSLTVIARRVTQRETPSHIFRRHLKRLISVFLQFLARIRVTVSNEASNRARRQIGRGKVFTIGVRPNVLPF